MQLVFLAVEDAVPGLPWPYCAAIGGSLAAAILALWKRDIDREKAKDAQAKEWALKSEARETILCTRLAENTEVIRLDTALKKA
jgi:hypothetical protein